MAKAAFYDKPGTLADKVIRWRTGSDTSHVELLLDDGFCYSSSLRDGGVRRKRINLDDGWYLVDLPWVDDDAVRAFFAETKGAPYDLSGTLIGQSLFIRFHAEGKWFCSEWCAQAMGLGNSWRYSPALLFQFLENFELFSRQRDSYCMRLATEVPAKLAEIRKVLDEPETTNAG